MAVFSKIATLCQNMGVLMAWHSVSQAQTLAQKSRRTLYRDMAAGRVSWRMGTSGHREIETSELIRAYGALSDDGTAEWPTVTQVDGTQHTAMLLEEIRHLREEVAGLRDVLMRIEHRPDPAPAPVVKAPFWRFWRR